MILSNFYKSGEQSNTAPLPHSNYDWTIDSMKSELIEGNGYEGRQTSKGELFVKVFGMSRDCEGAHIHFKMAASV